MSRQLLLHGLQKGTIEINALVSVLSKDGMTTYFVGDDNYFSHPDEDAPSRRYALAQLMASNHVRPVELESCAFAIPHRTLMNWKQKLEEEGS